MSAQRGISAHAPSVYPLPTFVSPQSIFSHSSITWIRPSTPSTISLCVRPRYIPSSSTLTTPAILLTPRPCCRQNLFQRSTQLLPSGRFSPPRLTVPPTYLLSRLPVANLQYQYQRHPIRHFLLPIVNVLTQCLGSRFFVHLRRCLVSPGPVPLPLWIVPC